MYGDALWGAYIERDVSRYQRETVSIEEYKANPNRWPEVNVLKQGTRLRCVKLVRHFTSQNSEYAVWAEVLDGGLKGEVLALFGAYGDPGVRGSLRLNTKFLEKVQ